MALRVEVVGDDRGLAQLEGEWDALFADTPEATGFQTFTWATSCRAHVSPAERRLFTLVVRDGGEAIGILPTEIGARGDLCFIGDTVSNYLGPVYRGTRLDDVVGALRATLDEERRVRLVDLRGLRTDVPFLRAWSAADEAPGWRAATATRTARCPYLDLSAGWKAILARRKSSSRTLLARKQKTLARLGRAEFVETGDPAAVRAALPEMFRLFTERWAGRHESGGFAGRHRVFHTHAAPALAAAGQVRLSLLRLDGHVVAFSYGVRGSRGITSYVIAHDGALAVHSPGAVLLVRMLEAACARGDPEYDFSLGEEDYKEAWATGSRDVVRLLQSRRQPTAAARGALRALGSRAWDAARSIRPFRALKRDGPRRWLLGPPAPDVHPDAPGLAAGAARAWHVHRLTGDDARNGLRFGAWSYADLRESLSPRLLALALERSYRNDVAVPLYEGDRLLGLVWRASPGRRALVLGGRDVAYETPVYYHPVAAPGRTIAEVVRALRGIEVDHREIVVVAQEPDVGGTEAVDRFAADLRFKPKRGLAAPRPRPR